MINDETFRYLEKVTKLQLQLAYYTEALSYALKNVVSRPYAVYLMRKYRNYANEDYWIKEKKSSFKNRGEALRRAGQWRLTECGPDKTVVIRHWDNEASKWETLTE